MRTPSPTQQKMSQPTAKEQELLELMNRMRLHPDAELQILLDKPDADVQYALDYYQVNLDTLKKQWATLVSVAPLAWSSQLQDAATAHNLVMIEQKQQAHILPGEGSWSQRMAKAGYQATFSGENIYAAAESPIFAHTGLAIDWGQGKNSVDGIQNGVSHRANMMSNLVREVGISAIEDNNSAPLGPLVITEDFGTRNALSGKAWLLGVAFDDINEDGWYQAGEGLNDVSVQIRGIDNPSFKDTIAVGEAGGYQELLDPGKYQVDFSRNGQVISSQTATIDSKITNNVKLDLVLPLQNLNTNQPVNTVKPDLALPVVNLQSITTDAHLLDLRTDASKTGIDADLSDKTIALKFTKMTSDASYHNYAGFYQVENEQGTVIDPSNSKSYQPGDNGYLAAALRRSQVTNQGVELDKNGLTGSSNLQGGHIYAPFLVANGRVNDILSRPEPNTANNVYFHYQAANADKAEHVRMLGANNFGFEDLFGGGDRDYNDLTFQVTAKVL
jgi:Domain of unknown function (DUF4114)/Cysteine-rich secretory protein family